MLNDIRYALRTMRQNPGFALTAIFSIALGIGVNSTIFSFANGLLLRPLPRTKSVAGVQPDHSAGGGSSGAARLAG